MIYLELTHLNDNQKKSQFDGSEGEEGTDVISEFFVLNCFGI
jgi:hypothetical protein